jgi:integrase
VKRAAGSRRRECGPLRACRSDRERNDAGDCVLRRLRLEELQALRCSAIDLGASTIRVEGSWDQYEGEIDPKSDTSTRSVPLLAVLRQYLDEHLLATRRSGDDLVLGRRACDPFVPSTVRNRALRAVGRRAATDRVA